MRDKYKTIFDMDFSTQGTQTLTTDGNYTIGGYQFTKQNSSYDRLATTLDSNGLTFYPSQTADWNVGNGLSGRNLPMVAVKISNVSSEYDISKPVRVWYYNPGNTSSTNYEGSCVTLGTGSAHMEFLSKRHCISSLGGPSIGMIHTDSNSWYNNFGVTLNTTNDVIMFEVTNMFIASFTSFYGSYVNNSWPDLNNMLVNGYWKYVHTYSASVVAAMQSNGIYVCMGAQRAGSSNNSYQTSFKRLRIDIGI